MASREALDSLNTTNSVWIYWVPSHQGIDGIETADVLAKEGVELTNDRTEIVPILPPNATNRPGETGRHASKKQVEEYQDLPNL